MNEYQKMKKGDKITWDGKTGVLLSDAKYFSTGSSGMYYAAIEWEWGTQKNFCLCRIGLKKIEEANK